MNVKKIIRAGVRFLTSSDYRFIYLANAGRYDDMPDEEYLRRMYRAVLGKPLNLNHPQSFNEKLQWLKLYDRNPDYVTMVDKYEVKQYVAGVIGEEYIIPTLGVWENPDDIDFENLPDQFVLKCNHNSGLGMCICKDKSQLDYDKVRNGLRRGLAENYYLRNREWPYKNVKRKVIAEKFMTDSSSPNGELVDYKLMCFNGKVRCSFTCTDRFSKDKLKVTFYDTDWKKMPFERHYPSEAVGCSKPRSYDLMVKLAEKLAVGIPFVRIDFYEIEGRPYFGEMTFFPGSGLENFTPESWDYDLGKWLALPE